MSNKTGYLLSDGVTDLSDVFMNINNAISLTSPNIFRQKTTFSGNIDLSNCFLYGRNDGSEFNVSFNSIYPIGYTSTFSYSQTITKGVSTSFNPSFIMSPGVWIINLQATITGGVSSWAGVSGFIQINLPTINSNPPNSFIVRNKSMVLYNIHPQHTTYLQSILTSMIIIVIKSASLIFNVIINSPTNPNTIISGGMTKIA
jgi:hypothetical protein